MKGVTKNKGRFQAQIAYNGKTKYLGLFKTEKEAEDCYNSAKQEQKKTPRKRARNNKSGCTGVHWDKRKNKWRAEIFYSGKKHRLGWFFDKARAKAAYEREVIKHKDEIIVRRV